MGYNKEEDSDEHIEYIHTLRAAILEAYDGLILGLHASKKEDTITSSNLHDLIAFIISATRYIYLSNLHDLITFILSASRHIYISY
jgi:hypothetical protein